MNIRIIRGTKQIGGSAVEITTEKVRIFIDFGSELNDEPRKLSISGLTKGKSNCDAVFFSHNHGDHVGMMKAINKDIPLYIGPNAKGLMQLLAERTKNRMFVVSRVDKMKKYIYGKSIKVKDIIITPYYVDHSAFDASMFLIEADGKRVLYTGDFRGHGFLSKGLTKTLEKYIKKVDAVICEGTTLSRLTKKSETERELQERFKKVIKNNKYVFVVCSSTNIYRIASICNAVNDDRYIITDKFQDKVNKYIILKCGKYELYNGMKKSVCYKKEEKKEYIKKGFVTFIRADHFGETMLKMFPNSKIICSMWKGYLENNKNKKLCEMLKNKKYEIMHTSGHADEQTIKLLLEKIKPKKVISIHTENPKRFIEFVDKERCVDVKDGEIIKI